MPKELHKKLAKKAKEKGLTGDEYNAYVYGTLATVESKKKKKKK